MEHVISDFLLVFSRSCFYLDLRDNCFGIFLMKGLTLGVKVTGVNDFQFMMKLYDYILSSFICYSWKITRQWRPSF